MIQGHKAGRGSTEARRHGCREAQLQRGTEMAGVGDGQREGKDGSKVERKAGRETGDGERREEGIVSEYVSWPLKMVVFCGCLLRILLDHCEEG